MADDIVIRADGLGKKYVIGHAAERERYVALRDVMARGARAAWRKTADVLRGRALIGGDTTEEFWALRDVSFEVKRGEVLGIIGRNGAGKSTLLKVLSRITEPSEGRVTIRGRVASLLEVGTGFHPELTGRENIYLNGAVLGMTRAEIRRKFDEIVAFAEVEKFLDTPVKRYSSGMYVRLAFAVAAHLEPEILVVDEVLAVGDAEFQKKCINKMDGIRRSGRTVLFVTHHLPTVLSLTSAAMVLERGRVAYRGSVSDALSKYLHQGEDQKTMIGRQIEISAALEGADFAAGAAFRVRFDVMLRGPLAEPRLGIGINDASGSRISTLFSETARVLPAVAAGNALHFQIVTEPVRFAPGILSFKLALAERGEDIETYEDTLQLVVPEYSPFVQPARSRPRGSVLVTSRIEFHEAVH